MNDLSTVFLEITNYCSKSCKHCFNHAYKRQVKYMTIDDIKYVVTVLKMKGIKQIKIVGGEPLEHPFFASVLDIMNDGEVPYIIVTDSKNILEYVSQLKENHWLKQIRVSIDGGEKIHDTIREKGDFQKVMDIVTTLKKNDISVALNYTINKLNYNDIDTIWEIAHEMGVCILYGVDKHCDNELNEEMLAFGEEDALELFNRINKIKQYNHELYEQIWSNLYDDEEFILSQKEGTSLKQIGCSAGQMSCVIDAEGNVFPCVLLKNYNCFGNIFQTNFDLIWSSMNKNMSSLTRNFDDCDSCVYKEKCTGGCRGNAFYFGDIHGKDPNCILYTNWKDL